MFREAGERYLFVLIAVSPSGPVYARRVAANIPLWRSGRKSEVLVIADEVGVECEVPKSAQGDNKIMEWKGGVSDLYGKADAFSTRYLVRASANDAPAESPRTTMLDGGNPTT